MINKVAGLARAVAILIAIVAAFLPAASPMVPLVLLLLGLIAGFAYTNDDFMRLAILALVLPTVGAALGNVPEIGAQLTGVMGNVAIAVGGALATRVIIRLYEVVVGDIKGLAG